MPDTDLVQSLADDLAAAIRQRDAADPDAPAWEAEARARWLERLIAVLQEPDPERSDERPRREPH